MKCDPSVPLRADVIYLSPTGRRCRWLPAAGDQHQLTAYATFVYLHEAKRGRQRHTQAAQWHDGFCLSPANYQLLKVDAEGVHAAAR